MLLRAAGSDCVHQKQKENISAQGTKQLEAKGRE
jgi:hypothetical protein